MTIVASKLNPELSEREREVLALLAKGFSAREIAERVGLTRKTVCSHTERIYKKLNVNRRAEAAVEAVHLGLA